MVGPSFSCSKKKLVRSGENLLFMASANDISQFCSWWIIDCGSTDHMPPDFSSFSTYSPNHEQKKVFIARGAGGGGA